MGKCLEGENENSFAGPNAEVLGFLTALTIRYGAFALLRASGFHLPDHRARPFALFHGDILSTSLD